MEVLSSQILFLSAFQESNQRIMEREERGRKIFNRHSHHEFSLEQRRENRNHSTDCNPLYSKKCEAQKANQTLEFTL